MTIRPFSVWVGTRWVGGGGAQKERDGIFLAYRCGYILVKLEPLHWLPNDTC